MKKIMFLATALFAAATLQASAQTQTSGMLYENTIEVTGRAQKEVTPDEIYIRIVIDETALKQKQSIEKMESDMIKKLKSLGIDTDKNLKIGNMSSSYKDYFLNKNAARTSATYDLMVSDIVTLGRVYQGLESLGISNMNITKLSHSKIEQIQDSLRTEALLDAQKVAKTLAKTIGQTAGRAVQIIDYNNDIYVPAPQARGEMMFATKAVADNGAMYDTELEFKDIKLSYNLQAKFELR